MRRSEGVSVTTTIFEFQCPRCLRIATVPAHVKGEHIKCPECGNLVKVPDGKPRAPAPPTPSIEAPRTLTPEQLAADSNAVLHEINYRVGCIMAMIIATIIVSVIGAFLAGPSVVQVRPL